MNTDFLLLTSQEWEGMKLLNAEWNSLSTPEALLLLLALLGQTRFDQYLAAATQKRRLEIRIQDQQETVTLSA